MAHAKAIGQQVAALMMDVKKYFDHVDHEDLVREAKETAFPLRLLKCLCAVYAGPRIIQVGMAASQPIDPDGTVLPGCSNAMTVTKLLVVQLIAAVRKTWPSVRIWNVVDDYSLLVTGTAKMAGRMLAGAANQLVAGLVARKLPLAPTKTFLLASSEETADAARKVLAIPATTVKSAVVLGADVTMGKRSTKKRNERTEEGKRRHRKLLSLKSTGANVSRLQISSVNTAELWGSAGMSHPDGALNAMRVRAGSSLVRLTKGQSAKLAMAAALPLKKLRTFDPAFISHRGVVELWATAIWTGYPDLQVLQDVMAAAATKLVTAIHPWSVATDPAAVCLLVLDRLRWKVHNARVWVTDVGLKVDLMLLAPKAVGHLADESTRRWSERQFDGGLNTGVAWDTYARLRRAKEWTTRDDAVARKMVSLGVISDKDKARQGHSDGECGYCGHAEGGLFHLHYKCDATLAKRRAYCSETLLVAADRIPREHQETFARGILPDVSRVGSAPYTSEDAPVFWKNKPASGRLTGIIFADGSSKQGWFSARAGWALVQVDTCGELVAAVWGPVPLDQAPKQSSPEAEDYALSRVVDFLSLPEMIMVDCLGTVQAANAHPLAVTGPRHPRAHMWIRYHSVSEGYKGVRKTKGHATTMDVHNGVSTEWERKGNGHADFYAKEGADAHTSSELTEQAVTAMRSIHTQGVRWVTRSHSGLQDARVVTEEEKAMEELDKKERKRKRKEGFAVRQQEAWQRTKKVRLAQRLGEEAEKGSAEASYFKGHRLRTAYMEERQQEDEAFLYCERCGAYAWKKTSQLHRTCTPGRMRGLDSQLSRIRRNMHPACAEKGGIVRQAVLPPPLAALQVEKLRRRAAEFDAKMEPRLKLRKMMEGENEHSIKVHYGIREALLPRYGILLEEVGGMCADIRNATSANRPKKRRLVVKTGDAAALSGVSGIEEGAAFRAARRFKAREGHARYAAANEEE